ncbi:SNF2 helicase-associated domain-containing protein, partial [Streptomyces sp. NPDC058221]|uniref:SNF2 helicase-associated domain-containing protein n=1 Tax=Streptomyces sp. NPDC058221 TaxID=3346388 RepID=UPI0036EA0568
MAITPPPQDAAVGRLLRCAAVFLPAALPREGRIAFWDPEGAPLPGAVETGGVATGSVSGSGAVLGSGSDSGGRTPEISEITVARRHGGRADDVRPHTVPALVFPLADAVPLLARARHQQSAHPATRCWGAAALHALHLVARGRMLPGLTPDDHDAWRAGPRAAEDIAHLRAVAAAMPAEGYAVPFPGRTPLQVPDPEPLIGSFLDAVADTLPRTPAAAFAMGAPFAAQEAQHLPGAREWAVEVAAGLDAGVRVSLRLDLSAYELFDTSDSAGTDGQGDTTGADEDDFAGPAGSSGDGGPSAARHAAAAITQVHSLADPTYVVDAAALWNGGAGEPFGPRARIDAVLALRRAARVWAPLERLLDQPVPDVLALTEDELYELLGDAGARLSAAGVSVHWPRELARSLTAAAVVRTAPGTATDGTAFFDAEQLFAFNWQLSLGDQQLTEAEMDVLAEAHRPVVRLRDQWVVVDPALVRKARKRELGLLDPVDALAVALTGSAEVDGEQVDAVPVGALAALRSRIVDDDTTIAPPPGL